jgi:hypothetical protein
VEPNPAFRRPRAEIGPGIADLQSRPYLLPTGLGIYWAWVHCDRSANAKTAGIVAALAGALVGGWLGLNATAGLLALITTIVGATVGVNLILIAFDILGTRSVSDRHPATSLSPASSGSSA